MMPVTKQMAATAAKISNSRKTSESRAGKTPAGTPAAGIPVEVL
jgi:hypothetical protein